MSLLKLLTVGQSFCQTQDTRGRYKLSTNQLRFNLTPTSELTNNQIFSAGKDRIAPPTPSRLTGATRDGSPFRAFQLASTVAPATPLATPGKPERRGKSWLPRPSMLFQLPFKAAVKFDRPPVQVELSLDRIQVVRNDLREADLEVVPVRQREPKPERSSKLGTRELWSRLLERALAGPSGA